MTPYIIALAALALLLERTRKKCSLATKPKTHSFTLRHTTEKQKPERRKNNEDE